MSNKIIHLSDINFQTKIKNSQKWILVDFWAEWCIPCKQIAPILDEIAEEYANQLCIGKLNIDLNPEITRIYGIRSIPTLIIFKGSESEPIARQSGSLSKLQLKKFIDQYAI